MEAPQLSLGGLVTRGLEWGRPRACRGAAESTSSLLRHVRCRATGQHGPRPWPAGRGRWELPQARGGFSIWRSWRLAAALARASANSLMGCPVWAGTRRAGRDIMPLAAQ